MKQSMHRIATLVVRLASAAPSPAKLSLAVLFSAMALAIGAQQVSAATVTYIVGTCRSGTRFSTIQKALDASPAPDTVEVCPGIYAEQITISHPVTLEGIEQGNGAQVRIVATAMTINTTATDGNPAAAQIFVNNVTGGDVNLTNLLLNGLGNQEGGTGVFFIGVLYLESSGTINQVTTSNQDGTGVTGFGMWIVGGSSKSSVTVENCSVHDFSQGGIFATSTATATNLTLALKNDVVSAVSEGVDGIFLDEGTDPTVSGNTVSGGTSTGIVMVATEGSITGNTILGSQVGIELASDGPSVTSNNIYDTEQEGIDVGAGPLKVSKVEHNIIKSVNAGSEGETGINLHCSNISSTLVNSNTFMDMDYGYGNAPAGFAGSDTYLGVLFKVGTCTGGSVPSKASAAARLKLPGQSLEQ
jgi:parallel beta-helix repeat protein